MTISLEQVADGSVHDRNFQTLTRLMVDTGGVSLGLRFGQGTIVWPGGSPNATPLNVSHGLAGTSAPVYVGITNAGSTNAVYAITAVSLTQFTVIASTNDGSSPAGASNAQFMWMVFG